MRDLPVYEATVEVLQGLLIQIPQEEARPSIGVDIKAKRKVNHEIETGSQVFYIRVTSSEELDLQSCFKNDHLKRLKEILLCMQSGEEGSGHLSVQRQADQGPGCVREVYWLDQKDGGVSLTCQSSTHVSPLDAPEEESEFVIHFRVIQSESHILSEGHRIYKFLHKMKLLNEKVTASYSMKVYGTVCQTDFSVKNYRPARDVSVAEDIKYHLGKECLKSLWCGTVRAFPGRHVNIDLSDRDSQIKGMSVSTVSCFYPLTERYRLPGEMCGNILMNFYGPGLTPLRISSQQLQNLDIRKIICWEEFGLQLTDTDLATNCDVTMGVSLRNRKYLPSWATGCTSFLLFLAVIFLDKQAEIQSSRNHEIIQILQDDVSSLENMACQIIESLNSCIKPILVLRETEFEKMQRKTYLQYIEMVADSMCDVFNHSINVNFREQMMALLQVDSKIVKKEMKKRLVDVAGVSKDTSQQVPGEDSDSDIEPDEWDDDSRWRLTKDRSPLHGPNLEHEDLADTSQSRNILHEGPNSQGSEGDREVHVDTLPNQIQTRQGQVYTGIENVDFDGLIQELDFFEEEAFASNSPDDNNHQFSSDGANRVEADDLSAVASADVLSGAHAQQRQQEAVSVDEWLNEVMLDVADWI